MHQLRKRLQGNDGFAMVIALVVIVVVLLLAAALISSSITTSTHTNQEYGRSSALAAANAGLEAAVHRLSSQAEETAAQEKLCFTSEFVALSGGVCLTGTEETLANGTSFKYAVSPVLLSESEGCAGLWVVAPDEATITQRCITAIGTASNGVKARAQERVVDVKAAAKFPVSGLFSYGELKINNQLVLNGEIATTGILNVNNKVEATETVKAKYGTSVIKESNCATCVYSKLTAAELAAAPYKLPEPSAKPYEEYEKSNNNSSLTIVGGTLNAKRELSANGVVTIKIPAGTYDFCSVHFNNEATVEYTPPVTIYLDAYYRTGSTCTNNAETGGMNLNNKVRWLDTASTKKANDMRIFVWGKPKETGSTAPELNFNNNNGGPFYAEIYAPYSYVNVNNELKMVGSIVGGTLNLNNKAEITGQRGAGETGLSGTSFYPTAYHQCGPSYTVSNPASGCS